MNASRKQLQLTTRRSALRRTSGYTFIELIGTMVLLGTALALVVPILAASHAQRRAADARFVALQEAANIMERFAARDWEEVTQESAESIRLSEHASRTLKDVRLTIRVKRLPEGPPAKRITVELHWQDRAGTTGAPARLTCFIYQKQEASP